jgi:DNA-directed RNA polymerase subunit RPC12/RpoP
MDPRTIFNYKCHNCKQEKEPDDFGYNNQTKTKRVTCNDCHQKRTEGKAKLKERRSEAAAAAASAEAYYETPEVDHTMTPSTEEEEEQGSRVIFYMPLATSEEEPPCENACANRLECVGVRARFTCGHQQCVRTHLMLGRCIACSCSILRFEREVNLDIRGSSSSAPAEPRDRPEPEEEMEPGECLDTLSLFVTEHP